MGERLLCKQEVIGSNPFTSTIWAPPPSGISAIWHRRLEKKPIAFAGATRRRAC